MATSESDNKQNSESNGDPLNLDLILRVQQARMQHDRTLKPSQTAYGYWIEAKPLTVAVAISPRAGEWVIRTTASEIDDLWARIAAATEAGALGYKSKTARTNAAAPDYVICIRTVDSDNEGDVTRVYDALRGLGITAPISYQRIESVVS